MLCGFYLYAHRGARYYNGTEYSSEVTWKHKLTESIALQPSFQYISNSDGNYTVASLRLYVISNPSQLLSHKKC